MDEGYIKLFRSMTSWEWYQDANTMRVFLHLLLKANWEDSRYRNHPVPRGSLVCGRKQLAQDLKISEQSIRTALIHLKSTNEITIESTNRFSIIHIVNWEKYQVNENLSTNKITNKATNNQPATNQQLTTSKEYKEIKNIRREEERESSINPEDVQNLFNKVCIFFKPCLNLTKTRLSNIKLLRQQFNLNEIEEVFTKANQSEFLQGKNDRAWVATFDWLIDMDNFVKVKEGYYANAIRLKVPKEQKLTDKQLYALENDLLNTNNPNYFTAIDNLILKGIEQSGENLKAELRRIRGAYEQ